MTRLPRLGGATLAAPYRTIGELKRALLELCNGHDFDDNSAEQYHVTLARIIGDWLSGEGRLKAAPVASALRSIEKGLSAASALLGGLETGLRSEIEIVVASHVLDLLSKDPTVGSREAARALLSSFRQDAERISHACMIAAASLPDHPEKRGAKKKDWYDAFAAFLLNIAEKARVRPTLYRDREDGLPTGWLLDAAREFETFLPPDMRSPSDAARYKRLERSKNRLQRA
jgi:hypothetical protein